MRLANQIQHEISKCSLHWSTEFYENNDSLKREKGLLVNRSWFLPIWAQPIDAMKDELLSDQSEL